MSWTARWHFMELSLYRVFFENDIFSFVF